MIFQVKSVIDEKTIDVGEWKLGDNAGSLVQIKGIVDADSQLRPLLKSRLEKLLVGQQVELSNGTLKSPDATMLTLNPPNVLQCTVMLNGIDVATYFPKVSSLAQLEKRKLESAW